MFLNQKRSLGIKAEDITTAALADLLGTGPNGTAIGAWTKRDKFEDKVKTIIIPIEKANNIGALLDKDCDVEI